MIDYQMWGMGATMLTAIVVTGMQNKARFDAIDTRLEGIDKQLGHLQARVDKLQSDLYVFNRELGRHDARLDAIEAKDK